jgi:hypothetical protein
VDADGPIAEILVEIVAPVGRATVLVVAMNPSLARFSASFSPSVICTGMVSGAAISSGNRYGIFAPSGAPLTHICPFHRF